MKKLSFHIILCCLAVRVWAGVGVSHLECEQLSDPEGIDVLQPRLSWQIESRDTGVMQTAWQVLVASSPALLAADKGDLWTSAKVAGDQSRMIGYGGSMLRTGMRCY